MLFLLDSTNNKTTYIPHTNSIKHILIDVVCSDDELHNSFKYTDPPTLTLHVHVLLFNLHSEHTYRHPDMRARTTTFLYALAVGGRFAAVGGPVVSVLTVALPSEVTGLVGYGVVDSIGGGDGMRKLKSRVGLGEGTVVPLFMAVGT